MPSQVSQSRSVVPQMCTDVLRPGQSEQSSRACGKHAPPSPLITAYQPRRVASRLLQLEERRISPTVRSFIRLPRAAFSSWYSLTCAQVHQVAHTYPHTQSHARAHTHMCLHLSSCVSRQERVILDLARRGALDCSGDAWIAPVSNCCSTAQIEWQWMQKSCRDGMPSYRPRR
jgi:hypothetical protein